MKMITANEIRAVLILAKSPEMMYNAHTLSKIVGISSMGTWKMLKRLEKESVVRSKKIGRSTLYQVNVENTYARNYITFLLSNEASSAPPQVKRWVNEIKKIKNADIAVLFGSVLRKENPADIDVLLVTNQKRFENLKKEIGELNAINRKKIHPVYQTAEDLQHHIKTRDPVILNAIKGIVVFGEQKYLEVVAHESRKE